MSRKKVILRADAGKSIGYGHFIRTLALAGYLKEDFDCIFCTFNPSEFSPTQYQLEEIAKVCKYHHIPAKSHEEYNQKFIDTLSGDEIVVLDNYYFQTDYQKQVRDKGCRLVCVDDMHDRHMVADLVLTGCPLQESDFSLEPYTRFCGGINHSFLREEFLNVPTRKELVDSPKNIVVAIGGADPYCLTRKIIDIVRDIDKRLNIAVIAGDAVDINGIYDDNANIYRRLSAKVMVDLFLWADMGILSASTICIEALACHLPVAAGWYVDNQEEFYKYGISERLFMPLGNLLMDRDSLRESIINAINSPHINTPTINFVSGKRDIIRLFKTL